MGESKILPYGRQSISEEDISAVVEVLRSDFLTQGPAIERFEKSLAEYIGCKHVVVVNSGTAALHLMYASLGVGPGDAVIVPALTFAATANAAVYCGATPIFADVNGSSGLLTVGTCAAAIQVALELKLTPRIIAPVHYAGLPIDMQEIIELAERHGCRVVEDACHALGAEYKARQTDSWRRVGNWGPKSQGACFSFHPVKHVATGEGGAIATDHDEIAISARLLRTHGITKNSLDFQRHNLAIDKVTGKANPWYYEMQRLGWNYRMCDLSAALGNSQMRRVEEFVAKRRLIASWYHEAFLKVPNVQRPAGDTATSRHSWHLYPINVDFKAVGKSRAQVMNCLRDVGVGTQVHYLPVPDLPYYQKSMGGRQKSADWNSAGEFYSQALSLPMYPDLTSDDVLKVVSAVEKVLQA